MQPRAFIDRFSSMREGAECGCCGEEACEVCSDKVCTDCFDCLLCCSCSFTDATARDQPVLASVSVDDIDLFYEADYGDLTLPATAAGLLLVFFVAALVLSVWLIDPTLQ